MRSWDDIVVSGRASGKQAATEARLVDEARRAFLEGRTAEGMEIAARAVAARHVARSIQTAQTTQTGQSHMSNADDLEDILNDYDGVGEWETDNTEAVINRYLFPRFVGAEKHGTCEAKGKAHKGLHTESDKCSEFAPDMGDMYMSRSGIAPYETDVETVEAWLEAPRNIVGAVNLLGDPGTGKTALIEAATTRLDRGLMTWLCTPDDTRDSLFLRFVGEGKGEKLEETGERSPYTYGPIPYAAKHGLVLYMDEWMMLQDGVKPVLYPLADGRRFLPGGNVDGSPLEIHPDFRLVLSSNPLVRGASMPEPMASRCASTTLTVETSASMLRDLGIDDGVVNAWETLGEERLWRPAIRECRLADYWLSFSVDQAVSAMVPEHCPDSQREAVTNTVKTHLGGDSIRSDGRLVVS